jgi:hypothetical protein
MRASLVDAGVLGQRSHGGDVAIAELPELEVFADQDGGDVAEVLAGAATSRRRWGPLRPPSPRRRRWARDTGPLGAKAAAWRLGVRRRAARAPDPSSLLSPARYRNPRSGKKASGQRATDGDNLVGRCQRVLAPAEFAEHDAQVVQNARALGRLLRLRRRVEVRQQSLRCTGLGDRHRSFSVIAMDRFR